MIPMAHRQIYNPSTTRWPGTATQSRFRQEHLLGQSVSISPRLSNCKEQVYGQTIILDAVQNDRLLGIGLVAGNLTRITAIEFRDGGRVRVQGAPSGIIRVDGSNTDGSQFRWDNCKWDNLNGYPVMDTVIGVIDHNQILFGNRVNEWIYPYGSRWNGGSWGDGSWAAPANWGSPEFLFFEDNTIICSNTRIEGAVTDCFGGARIVFRRNVVVGANIGNHGTESPGRSRSSRAMDIYLNQFNCNNVNRYAGSNRGGGELYHDNTVTNCRGNPNTLNTLSAFKNADRILRVGRRRWNEWVGRKNNPGNAFYSGTAASSGRPHCHRSQEILGLLINGLATRLRKRRALADSLTFAVIPPTR